VSSFLQKTDKGPSRSDRLTRSGHLQKRAKKKNEVKGARVGIVGEGSEGEFTSARRRGGGKYHSTFQWAVKIRKSGGGGQSPVMLTPERSGIR